MTESQNQKPHVIIIGAGFGGLQAAKKLGRKNVRVTVIDRTNYHLFQPLLYQVATAALSPADIAAPVRAVLSKWKNVEVILAEVQSVDVDAKKIKTTDTEIGYDFLILATGARDSHRRRSALASCISERSVRERVETACRSQRGSAHGHARDQSHRGRSAGRQRIYSLPCQNLGSRQQCLIRGKNARHTG